MKKRMRLLVLLLAESVLIISWLIIFGSCSNKQIPTSSEKSTTTDSTVTTYKPREIKTFTAEVSVNVVKKIECDPATNKPKPTKISVRNKKLSANATIDDKGELTVDAKCDSLEQVITVMDKEVFRLKQHIREKKTVVPQFKTRRLDVVCRWISGIALAILLIIVYRTIRKTILPV